MQPVGRPRDVELRRLEAEADELCSFVQQKANKQWLWLAMNRTTRQIIAFHVGDRSRESTRELWANIPEAYRERAMFYKESEVFAQLLRVMHTPQMPPPLRWSRL